MHNSIDIVALYLKWFPYDPNPNILADPRAAYVHVHIVRDWVYQ